jgi:hypothetical protein
VRQLPTDIFTLRRVGFQSLALGSLTARHLTRHGGDVEKSLVAVPANRSTRASLAAMGEPEIEATLAQVTRPRNGQAAEADDDQDPDRTAGLSVGAATGDGRRSRHQTAGFADAQGCSSRSTSVCGGSSRADSADGPCGRSRTAGGYAVSLSARIRMAAARPHGWAASVGSRPADTAD